MQLILHVSTWRCSLQLDVFVVKYSLHRLGQRRESVNIEVLMGCKGGRCPALGLGLSSRFHPLGQR